MQGWQQVRQNENIDLLVWWQYLVKAGIKKLAIDRSKVLKRQRIGQLKMMQIKQAFLTRQVSSNAHAPTELSVINLRIAAWYENESQKINLLSRAQDINLDEKVRIYHHSLHATFMKRSTITRLVTEKGEIDGHAACAEALEENVANHLLPEAPLDRAA